MDGQMLIALLAALGGGAVLRDVITWIRGRVSGEDSAKVRQVTAEARSTEAAITERVLVLAEQALDRAEADLRECMEDLGVEKQCRKAVEQELKAVRFRLRDDIEP